jgi:hypothetical protein
MDIHLIGVYFIGVHLTGPTPHGCVPRGRVPQWACTSAGVHLSGRASLRPATYWPCTSLAVRLIGVNLLSVHIMGMVCLEAFGIFNLGFLGKCPYAPTYSEIAKVFWPKFLESNNLEGHSKECVVKETTDTTFKQTISTNLYFGKSTKLPSTYRSFIRRFIHLQPCLRHVSIDLSISNTKAHVRIASDQPSEADIKQGEEEAAANVRNFAVGCVLLYFCKSA